MILIILVGLYTILENLKVRNVVIGKQFQNSENYQKFLKIVRSKKINIIQLEIGSKIYIEKNLYFDVLWPDSKHIITENSINNNALVCKLFYKNFTMLFTGDIEEETEKILTEKYGSKLGSDVLKVGHHGSKTSTSYDFLNFIKPNIALIGVGENNKFGHPNKDVIDRLENLRNKYI